MASYPLFLAISEASDRAQALADELGPVHAHANAGSVTGVDLFYRRSTDIALLGVNLDARLATVANVARIRVAAEQSHSALLEPARLSDDDRRRFNTSYLAQYDVREPGLPGLAEACDLLADTLGQPMRRGVLREANVTVRFKRGESWEPARARGLTACGVYLSTGVAPRPGDRVPLEFKVGAMRLELAADVLHVTPRTVADRLGAGGFGVRFTQGTAHEQGELAMLLALAAGTELSSPLPPPRRREQRYPIAIGVDILSADSTQRVIARDISSRGLFLAVEPLPARIGDSLALSIADPEGPIRVTTLVVRELAGQRGQGGGIGVELVAGASNAEDDARYRALVTRIGRRAVTSVLIGASARKQSQLCQALTAAGYIASGEADPKLLVARATRSPRPPDFIVVDESLGDTRPLETALAAHKIPVFKSDQPDALVARLDARLRDPA